MEKFNRFLLNTLCVLIFASTFCILGIFSTGSKIADIYRRNEPKEEVVKHEGEPVERQIMAKKHKPEDFYKLVIWDSSTDSEHTINVNPDEYDLYKVGEIFYTDENTIPDYGVK